MAGQHASAPLANGAARRSSSLAGTRLWNSPFLSREEQQALEAAAQPGDDVRGKIDLVREGDRTDLLFILTKGWACRYATTRGGARQLSTVLVPGDVANLDSFMFDRLDGGVLTVTDATVVALPRHAARSLAAEHSGIAQTFTWLAMIENAILERGALSLGRKSAIERVAHLLCELSVRLGAEEGDESRFALPLTQEHIGDAVGLTSVHVNRTMQQLRGEGLIVTADRKVTLTDVAALRRLAGFDPGYLHVEAPAWAYSA